MRRPTGSKLPLLIACPSSFALPWIDEPAGEPAIRGTAIHSYLEDVANLGAEAAIENASADLRPFLRAIDLDALPVDLLPEAAFALDWRNRSARYLGTGLGRAYGDLGPTEIGLTTDLLGVNPTAVKIEDYKTGRTRYGAATAFAQLLAGALAASLVYRVTEAHVGLIYIDSNGEAYPSRGKLNGWDLEVFGDELEAAMDKLGEARVAVGSGGMPDVRPGDHCVDMHCPAFRTCPAKSALVRHLPGNVEAFQRTNYLAPDNLARSWLALAELEHAIGIMQHEIRMQSLREPIDLGGGTMLGPKERRVETVDARVARDVLASLLGAEYAERAITLETSKSAIEDEAKLWRDKNPTEPGPTGKSVRVAISTTKGTGILDRVLIEIRNRGGTSTKITNNPGIYKIRKSKDLTE